MQNFSAGKAIGYLDAAEALASHAINGALDMTSAVVGRLRTHPGAPDISHAAEMNMVVLHACVCYAWIDRHAITMLRPGRRNALMDAVFDRWIEALGHLGGEDEDARSRVRASVYVMIDRVANSWGALPIIPSDDRDRTRTFGWQLGLEIAELVGRTGDVDAVTTVASMLPALLQAMPIAPEFARIDWNSYN